MKTNTLIVVIVTAVVAIVGALIACGMFAAYVDHHGTVFVLISRDKFGRWEAIREPEKMFQVEEIVLKDTPENYVPADRIMKLKNRVLKRRLEEKVILRWDDLENTRGLLGCMPEGKRLFAVETSAKTAEGKWILPGSRVDVIHVVQLPDNKTESHVVLRNILVLAVDLENVRPEDRPVPVSTTVALEVTPEEAAKLAKVVSTGTIVLKLRPYGDDEK